MSHPPPPPRPRDADDRSAADADAAPPTPAPSPMQFSSARSDVESSPTWATLAGSVIFLIGLLIFALSATVRWL